MSQESFAGGSLQAWILITPRMYRNPGEIGRRKTHGRVPYADQVEELALRTTVDTGSALSTSNKSLGELLEFSITFVCKKANRHEN